MICRVALTVVSQTGALLSRRLLLSFTRTVAIPSLAAFLSS